MSLKEVRAYFVKLNTCLFCVRRTEMSDFLQVADVLSIPLVRERVDDTVVCVQMCPQFYTSRISELIKSVVRTRYR